MYKLADNVTIAGQRLLEVASLKHKVISQRKLLLGFIQNRLLESWEKNVTLYKLGRIVFNMENQPASIQDCQNLSICVCICFGVYFSGYVIMCTPVFPDILRTFPVSQLAVFGCFVTICVFCFEVLFSVSLVHCLCPLVFRFYFPVFLCATSDFPSTFPQLVSAPMFCHGHLHLFSISISLSCSHLLPKPQPF